jgi:uncharacterized membrane protein YdjX (TVP38/TMEM64 family)
VVASGLAAVAVGLVALRAGDPVRDVLRLADWIRAQGGWGWGVLVALQMVVCLVGVLPASVLVIVAGSLYGLWYGFLLASVATLLGAVSAFLAGRFLLGPFLTRWVGRHFSLLRLDRAIVRGRWRFVLLIRMSPVFPFALVSYGLGVSGIRLRDYVVGTVGVVPALFALSYSGAVAGDLAALVAGAHEGRSSAELGAFGLGLVATLVVVGILGRGAYTTISQLSRADGSEDDADDMPTPSGGGRR